MGQRIDILSQTKTEETDTTLVLAPDGTGEVEWRAESGGGGGSPDLDGGNASSIYGAVTPIDGGTA